MTIAVTYADGVIFQHFGHTAFFKLYDTEQGNVLSARIVETQGSGHGALAGFLKEQGVDVLICGGIGGGAQIALAEAGIRLYGGVRGDADDAVYALLTGELEYDPCARCDHHGSGHSCGSREDGHSCGSHSCGHHE